MRHDFMESDESLSVRLGHSAKTSETAQIMDNDMETSILSVLELYGENGK